MPQVAVNIAVEDLVRIINNMKRNELETLLVLLTKEGNELLKRKKDIESGKVKTLSREEVFGVQR